MRGAEGAWLLVLTVLATGLACACERSAASGSPPLRAGGIMEADIAADLQRVRQSRVFFTHQSVGGNILAGVARLYAVKGGDGLRVIPLARAQSESGPAWVDASGGKNGDPKSKIDFFAETIRRWSGDKPTLAFMKFCYVDFNPYTNVDELFSSYQRTLVALKAEHPEIKFGHVTAPLMVTPTEMKWRMYRVIGRMVWEDAANAKRQEFNQRLRDAFSKDPIFDLALTESTRPDGSRETFMHNGSLTYSLTPAYTDDGGHLNETGQRIAAAAMIRFTARALGSSP